MNAMMTNFINRQTELAANLVAQQPGLRITSGPLPGQFVIAIRRNAPVLAAELCHPSRLVDVLRCVPDHSVSFVDALFLPSVVFPDGYLFGQEATVLWGGAALVHPNVLPQMNAVCIGAIRPGTSLPAIVGRLTEIVTYSRFNTASPLWPGAAEWALRHRERLKAGQAEPRAPGKGEADVVR